MPSACSVSRAASSVVHLGAGRRSGSRRASPPRVGQHVGAARARRSRARSTLRSSTGSFWRVSASADRARRCARSRAATPRPSRSRRPGGSRACSGSRAAPRGARSAGASGRPRRARSSRASRRRSTGRPMSAASRTARPHVVGEDEERRAEGAEAAVQRDAVQDRAHAVLADAEVERASASARQHRVGERVLLVGERRAGRRRP